MTGPVDEESAESMRDTLEHAASPPSDPAVVEARSAGGALRSVIACLTSTAAPPDVLREVSGRLRQVEDLLAPYGSVRSYEGASEASGLGRNHAFFDWSPQMGLANPLAPPLRPEVRDGTIVARARFGVAYEGPPGCVHGGHVAAAFDEVLGLAQSLSGQVGMTGTLTVKYRRPTPLNTELRFEGRVDSVSGRKVTTSGRLFAGSELTAEATALFVSISAERFRALSENRSKRPSPAAPGPGAG